MNFYERRDSFVKKFKTIFNPYSLKSILNSNSGLVKNNQRIQNINRCLIIDRKKSDTKKQLSSARDLV